MRKLFLFSLILFLLLFLISCKTQVKSHQQFKVPPSSVLVYGKLLEVKGVDSNKAKISVMVISREGVGQGFVYSIDKGQKLAVKVNSVEKIEGLKTGRKYHFLIRGTDGFRGTELYLVKVN